MPLCADHYITVDSRVKTSPKWSFGGRPSSSARAGTPGPGAYSPNSSRVKREPPAWGFTNGGRGGRASNGTPGPGSYNVGAGFGGPSYTMSARSGKGAKNANQSLGGTYTQFGY
mmetsp:Transcript_17709/g.35968  ORF Transcript_17709/g.35968 Transcript_17709/m.35968 type:complete len:114 (-) Transcript_17709:727-1068(-)